MYKKKNDEFGGLFRTKCLIANGNSSSLSKSYLNFEEEERQKFREQLTLLSMSFSQNFFFI